MRELIVVDGFNVLHAGVLRGRNRAGWRRPEARAKLLEALAPLAGGPAELRVVFDAPGARGARDIRRPTDATSVASGPRGAAGDDRGPAGATNVASQPGGAAGDDRDPAGATNVASHPGGAGGDDRGPAGATSVASQPGRAGGDIRRTCEATGDAAADEDTASPGRDAHRAKRRGPAAGRRPAGVLPAPDSGRRAAGDDGGVRLPV